MIGETSVTELFSANQAVGRSYGKLPAIRTRKSSDFLDATSRDRVAEPTTLFDSKLVYNKDGVMWHEQLNGVGAAAAHLPDEAAVDLTVGTASGEYAFRQGRNVYVFISGKSYISVMGVKFTAPEDNLVQRVGLFTDDNGMFFEVLGSVVSVVVRSKVTGSVFGDKASRAQWNLDKLDGSGSPDNPSGISVDFTKAQILVIDYTWESVGYVRFGVLVQGGLHYVHEHNHANIYNGAIFSTPDLMPRYEIRNTGITTKSNTLKQFGSSVVCEGSYLPVGRQNSIGNGITLRSISTTLSPIFAIRQRTTFSGIANRKIARWLSADFLVDADAHFEIRHVSEPGTITGDWSDFDTADSSVEYSVNISAVASGDAHIIDSGYISAGQGKATGSASRKPQFVNHHDLMTQNYDVDNSELIVIYAATISGTGNAGASLVWVELK